ncbi:MAG: hypothetical protein EAY75_07175 [Bacteroidetes bacterium]|nr:MAG: hypothetical protein EAY75_07175 [Bacteroidota bacterium]
MHHIDFKILRMHASSPRLNSTITKALAIAGFTTFSLFATAQLNTWRQIADTSANFYTIKADFMGNKAKQTLDVCKMVGDSATQAIIDGLPPEAKDFEYLYFMRWANFVEPTVAETKGDLNLMRQRYDKSMTAIEASPKNLIQNAEYNWALLGPVNQTSNMYGTLANVSRWVRKLIAENGSSITLSPSGSLGITDKE